MELQPTATLRSRRGMVAAIDHLAASAGAAMLRRGGTAVDAAIAANAVLAVTSQHLCGLGGDLIAVVTPPGERPIVLNSSGRAGSGADPERLRSRGHRTMPFRDEIATVTVPGCVDGWFALHERFGRLPIETLLQPAWGYAEDGFPASPTLVVAFEAVKHLEEAGDYTASGPLREGAVIRRPGVGRTLRAIASGGRSAFYEGEFAAKLIEIGDGEFAAADLAAPIARWDAAIGLEAFGATIWSAPPNSQGYLTLASAFIASGLELPSDPIDDRFAHLLVESSRMAGFDRLDVLGDGVDPAVLLDRAELKRRQSSIDPDRSATLGDRYQGGGTTAIAAVDDDRLGVSLIQSNASGFGAHIIVPGVRIFLQNRGIGFSLEPGHVSEYGPGRRPAHTLCPTAVTAADGALRGLLGTMGGDSQPQILLQLLARWLCCGQSPGDAMAAGRFVLSDPTDGTPFDAWRERGNVVVAIEGHAPQQWEDGLVRRGHRVKRLGAYAREFGHAQLVVVDDDGFAGATDPRTRFGAVGAI